MLGNLHELKVKGKGWKKKRLEGEGREGTHFDRT